MRSKDRLAELLQRAEASGGVYKDTVLPVEEDEGSAARSLPPDMEAMLQEAESAVRWAGELAALTARLRALHAHPTFHTSPEMQEQADSVVTQAHALGLKASGALRQLEQRATTAAAGVGGAAARAARLQAACCRRRYAAALEHHHSALSELRAARRRLLADQLALTNSEITEEECERLLDDNRLQVFVDNIEAETREARRGLREAEARRAELAKVEAALVDVRDLFGQLHHLVAAQQDQLDSVEYFALQATEHVGVGGHELLQGNVFRKKTKQKKIGLIICISVGVFIVLLVLIYT
ncbi:syntaxin-like [Cydia amplana]|uniref:syntaxin-like n=1 Tax=Cydia amplana TaxID=1869771 RepID=UPI002FE59623